MPDITLSFFLSNAGPLLILVLKVGGAIGLVGSVIEAVGMFAQHFANPYAQSFGATCIRFGKVLEAIGADVPKFVENATGWVSKFAKLFGTAAIFLFVCGLLFGARL
jgi:hypothetical protein